MASYKNTAHGVGAPWMAHERTDRMTTSNVPNYNDISQPEVNPTPRILEVWERDYFVITGVLGAPSVGYFPSSPSGAVRSRKIETYVSMDGHLRMYCPKCLELSWLYPLGVFETTLDRTLPIEHTGVHIGIGLYCSYCKHSDRINVARFTEGKRPRGGEPQP